MIILLVATFWTLSLSLVVGLCLAARRGDHQHEATQPVYRAGHIAAAGPDSERHARTRHARTQGDLVLHPG
jgi:hypothetical protein